MDWSRLRRVVVMLGIACAGLVACAPTPSGGVPSTTTVAEVGAVQVAAGGVHTCALLTNGTVTCWGYNYWGQLGTATNNGTGTANPTPTVVAGLAGVTQIAAGGDHTCALLTNGTVMCWGYNRWGQLGNATNNGTSNASPTPTLVAGLTGVTQIAAGLDHTCALLASTAVTCWGYNHSGQLGNGTNIGNSNANPTPAAVTGLSGVTQITSGHDHTCALLSAGGITCWGSNLFGQLGTAANSGTSAANPTPTGGPGLTNAFRVAAGGDHTCAVYLFGAVACWGSNLYGQLGNVTNSGSSNPNPALIGSGFSNGVGQIATGNAHTCVVTTGTVTCWGDNQEGELGNATNNGTFNANPTPTPVAALAGVTQMGGGQDHTCALLSNGAIACWGSNDFGQLGNATNNGNNSPNPTPAIVAGIP